MQSKNERHSSVVLATYALMLKSEQGFKSISRSFENEEEVAFKRSE